MASTKEYCVYTLDDNDDRGSVINMPTSTPTENCEPRKMNPYLTREELSVVEDVEPFWRRLRIGLLVTFCAIWVALLLSVITIVVLSKKCPPRPDLKFWQSKVAYYVDPFAFKDSDGNWIGDLNGLRSELIYIRDSVGAGFVILTPIFQGHYTNNGRSLGQVTDFEKIDPVLGTMSDFRNLLKTFQKQGLEVVISLDINGIAENHTWAKNPDYFQRYDFSRNLTSRNGLPAVLTKNNEHFHSIDNKLFHLNLTNPKVWEAVTNMIQFWLDEPIGGILLKNSAFYMESVGPRINPLINGTGNKNMNSLYRTHKVYTNESLQLVQKVRKLVDDSSSFHGRSRVLIVDSGDVGYGLDDTEDGSLTFLGSAEQPGGHLVFHRQFVINRGWKNNSMALQLSTISEYNVTSGSQKTKLALPSATDVDCRHDDLLATAAIFLLPGTPIVYYGSELGTRLTKTAQPPGKVYPMNKVPNVYESVDESALTCQLPMPWDRTGKRFSNDPNRTDQFSSYLKTYRVTETVESVTAIGRGPTLFSVVKKLIKLRAAPSLLWGEFEIMAMIESKRLEVFIRKAVGFPAFVIVFDNPLLAPDEKRAGIVIDLSEVCREVIARVIHPPRVITEAMQFKTENIYISMTSYPSIHVFECTPN